MISVGIYGTIGFFLHYIDASSEFIVFCRGMIGSLFIVLVMLLTKNPPDLKAIRKNFVLLFVSGVALGLNWVLLFAGYRYGIAVTSLCNYIAPIIVVIISSWFLKEKLSKVQTLCVTGAFIGILLLSGVFDKNDDVDYHCILYGLLAAIGFVVVVLCNKRIEGVKPMDKTLTQLFVSAITVLPFVIINDGFPKTMDLKSGLIILCLGVVHTGIAYILYFGSIDVLPANKVAIFGYLEPVLSVLTGAFIFNEDLSMLGAVGAVLILASALISESASINAES